MGGAQCLAHVAVDRREGETDACTAYMRYDSDTMPHEQYVCCECAVGMSAMQVWQVWDREVWQRVLGRVE